MKTIKQIIKFKASSHEIYEALMDSEKHSEFTGEEAKISRKIGGKVSAFGGWVEAENLELIPDKKIVQKWRGKDWDNKIWSKVTLELKRIEEGTELTLMHENLPENKAKSVNKGWEDHYWKPMKKMLED